MNRNKDYLDKLRKRLSPFAQTVLVKLLDFKKENSVCENTNYITSYNQKEQCNNRKVLIFDDFPSSTLPDKQAYIKKFDDFSDFGTQEIKNGCISLSSDLLLSIHSDALSNILVNSKIKSLESTKPTSYATTSTYAINDSVNDKKGYDSEEKHFVHWNELFDKDFFNDLDDHNISQDRILLEDKYNINVASLSFPSKSTCKHIPSKDVITNELIGKTIATKRKNITRVSDKEQKVKKIQNENIRSFRKEKYTKTVKNWLCHIDNSVKEIANIVGNNVNKDKDENKKKKSKKTIQAQLANKGGIMKFAKPKETNLAKDPFQCLNKQLPNPNKKFKSFVTDIEASSSKTTLKGRNENTKSSQNKLNESNDKPKTEESMDTKAKEKKTRSKFVAPALTLLPVKDVSYVVHVLYEHNINEHTKTLQILNITEIIIVLVYSNGFSQLNAQYASADCTPEGLMFLINEQYYYIKQFGNWFAELICQILNKNTIICFNAKEVLIFLMMHYDLSSCSFNILDAKIGASLLSPEDPPETFSKLQKLLGTTSEFTIAAECVLQRCAWHMNLLFDCACSLRALLSDGGLWRLFVEIEMKALPIIAEMEHRGVCVDVEHLKCLDSTLLSRMKEVEQECYEAAGKSFQINSALQVRNILYEELQLDAKSNIKIRETICKAKSTSEAMLRSLTSEHPLPKLILEYRHLHKAHATFVAGILQHVRDGVVKPTWEQTAAVTGRIACNNPNLQAIPKAPFSLTLYPGVEQTEGRAASMSFRDAYVSRAGHALLAADFKHAECRVFALAAADATLQEALRRGDLFTALAARWLNKSEEVVISEERERTKRIVYASLYGAGARKLAEILQIGYEQALSVLASFNRTFPSLKSFGRAVVTACERQGGRLVTPSGRARTFSGISSGDFALRSHAERQAINFIVQGSAADLCKAAMVESARQLRSARPALAARLVLQIHDELVWELPERELPRAAGIIKSAMEGCGVLCGLTATFPVGLASGPRWGDLTQL